MFEREYREMSFVQRWGIVRRVREQSVAEQRLRQEEHVKGQGDEAESRRRESATQQVAAGGGHDRRDAPSGQAEEDRRDRETLPARP